MQLNKKNLDKKILAVLIGCFLWYYVDSTSTIKQNLYGEVKYKDVPADLVPLQAPTRLKYYLKTNRYHAERISSLNVWFEISLKNALAGNNFVHVAVKSNDASRLTHVELPNEVIKIVMDKKVEKTVAIQAAIHSKLFPEYRLESLVLTPPFAKIEGPESLVSRVNEVLLEDISVDKPGVYTMKLKTKQARGLKIEPRSVQCQFKIAYNLITQNIHLPVKWVNLNKHLSVKRYLPIRILAKIAGRSENMKKLDFKDLFYYIDLKEIKNPGKYTLPLEFKRLEGIEITEKNTKAVVEIVKSSE